MSIVLPDWIAPINKDISLTELKEAQYQIVFPSVLSKISKGEVITKILDDRFKETDFLRWVMKNPDRKALYEEAEQVASIIRAAEILEIADNEMEDVQRSSLRIKTRQYLMESHNRKRYGQSKQIEFSGGISVSKALEEANARVVDASFEDIT